MALHYTVYISYAARPFHERELKELLDKSRANNFKTGITGMMLYLEGKFIQVLEGEEAAVKALLAKIKKDTRHTKIATLLEGQLGQRLFNQWTMGFKNLSEAEFTQVSGYQSPEVFFRQKAVTDDSHPVLIFLQLFFKKNWVDYPETSFS
ncbi:MAG: BLUF domain-containing protein [Cyclobacteriaceae bacterium]|nr:BLUF domain-containing protein [Cyclobacteriaceae bacterium]